MPKVSVVLSAYNSARYLQAAIDSILRQTFTDFELLLMDDGSTDDTPRILSACQDSRLTVVRSDTNLGIAAQANKGLALARGEYLARMDADDIAHPQRFEELVRFLDANPEVGICGGFASRFRENGETALWEFPTSHDDIQVGLLFRGSFCNPTTMMRLEVVRRAGLQYDSAFPPCEDYHLWYRLLKVTRGANIPKVLLDYRLSETQMTQAKASVKHANLRAIRRLMLEDLQLPAGPTELDFHESVVSDDWPSDPAFFTAAIQWMDRIYRQNAACSLYAPAALAAALSRHLRYRCQVADPGRIDARELYRQASFTSSFPLPGLLRARMLTKKLLART
jgi:hypothetical protein